MEDMRVQYCFHYLNHAVSWVAPHSHTGCELVYYASGEGDVEIGRDVLPYHAGMIALTYPGTPHGESWRQDTQVWCIIFEMPAQTGLLLAPEGIYPDDDGEIFGAVRAFFAAQQSDRAGWGELALCYLEIILRLIGSRSGQAIARRTRQGDRLEGAFSYLQDYYNTEIDLETLALSTGYSYSRFRHLFRERYHISPKQMLINKRIEAAKRLLREQPDEKIEVIAHACGFQSIPQFNVMFKQKRGMTPGEYRQMHKSSKQ